MALLIDIFGFLTVILHGLSLVARSLAIGGTAFLAGLAVPLAPALGPLGPRLVRSTRRWTGWSAVALLLLVGSSLAVEVAVLVQTVDLPVLTALGAGFARADLVEIAAALALVVLAWSGAGPWVLLALSAVMLASAALTSHAAAQPEGQLPLTLTTAAHQLGAAIWIGGIPYFLIGLAGARDGVAWRLIGKRFSQMSMLGVGLITVAGLIMCWVFIGSADAIWGTAYGVMVSTKVLLFLGLLGLGYGNFRLVERLRRDPATPIVRLKRFAEVEIGVGITVLFAAASITSLPAAKDLVQDRVPLAAIGERLMPEWPRLTSPDHDTLAIPALQAELDRQAAAAGTAAPPAFVPGAGLPPPNQASDIAWSEYNHHWSGILVLLIGLLALAERTGKAPWARHWPLLFLALAGFLLVRSDPETWPLGDIGFFESFRDPEVTQHRVFVLVIVAFGLFEWMVRTGRLRSARAGLVFPLLTAVGGGLLLAHSHSLGNVRQELLIEVTHVPLAVFGVAAGWARWLELRLPGRGGRIAAWVWPLCFALIGVSLLLYREA